MGLEPTTSPVTGERSSQLNYGRMNTNVPELSQKTKGCCADAWTRTRDLLFMSEML